MRLMYFFLKKFDRSGGNETERIDFSILWRGLAVLLTAFFMLSCRTEASLPRELQHQEVIFLIDSSQSMVESDPLRLIPETVLEMSAILPRHCSVGIYAYSNEVHKLQPLAGMSGLPAKSLQAINYAGYTNTGAAMQQAVAAFSTEGEAARSIVIITDGEIMLPSSGETLASVKAFQEAMTACRERGIKVYMLALGGKQTTPQANIYASDIIYATAPDASAVPQMGAGLIEANWAVGKFQRTADNSGVVDLSMPIPSAAVRHLRVVVRKQAGDTAAGGQLTGQNAGQEVYDGPALRIFAVQNPAQDIKLTGLKNGETVDVYPQLAADLETEVVEDKEAQNVTLKITPVTVDGNGQSLVADASFNGREIPVWLDDDYYPGTVQDGSICVELPQDWQGAGRILPAFAEWGWNADCQPAAVTRDIAKAEKQPVQPVLLILVIGGVGICLLAGLFIALRLKAGRQAKRRQPLPQNRPSWPEHYTGELTIRDIRTRSGRDHRVRVINLYRHLEHIALPLRNIFRECQLPDTMPELDGLGLHPGRKGIWLDNDSRATVLKDGELVLRGTSCFMGYDEPVQLSFGDGQLALTMVLKDLKPQS